MVGCVRRVCGSDRCARNFTTNVDFWTGPHIRYAVTVAILAVVSSLHELHGTLHALEIALDAVLGPTSVLHSLSSVVWLCGCLLAAADGRAGLGERAAVLAVLHLPVVPLEHALPAVHAAVQVRPHAGSQADVSPHTHRSTINHTHPHMPASQPASAHSSYSSTQQRLH